MGKYYLGLCVEFPTKIAGTASAISPRQMDHPLLAVLHAHLDYLAFTSAILLVAIFLHRRLRPSGRVALGAWLLMVALLFGGWFATDQAGRRERLRMQRMVEGYAPTYARELERMGHQAITLETDPEAPLYWQMIEAEKRWLAANPSVNDIYTMRILPDGRTVLMVDSETDYDRDGKFEGEREERTAIGEVYEETFPAAARAYATGEPTFEEEMVTDRWGTWVTAVVPMRDKNGAVEAILCVDFEATTWFAAMKRARLTTIGYLGALFLIFAALSGLASQQIATRDLAARQREQEALGLEKRKLETLVNSIDGIVWECEVPSYRFTFVSRQCERILGYTPEQWMAAPSFWRDKLHPEDAWAYEYCGKMVAGKRPYHYDYRMLAADGRTVWIRESGAILCDEKGEPTLVRGVFLDITEQKAAAEELEDTHRALMDSSRKAGMAEVATGVLHNVGNVLNSVNVSTNVINERLRASKTASLTQVAALLRAQNGGLAEFLTNDPRGKLVPELLGRLAETLSEEQSAIRDEAGSLVKNVAHIRDIVAMQQSFASRSGCIEQLPPSELIEDALRMNTASLARHDIEIVRDFAAIPAIPVDRHKALQILVNLIRIAKQSMDAHKPERKVLTLSIAESGDGLVRLAVRDTGGGILPENLPRIFGHGFTTKKDGHGFGLHSSANAAREMGGTLRVESDGLGTGATFLLELPLSTPTPVAEA